MTYAVTYTLSGKSYAVDSTNISDADLLELARLAASGSKADLAEFVTILAHYPTSYKILPPTPLKPEGPLGPLNDDVLKELGIDIATIIAIAMLVCLRVEREMRKMGLELSQHQVDQMVAKAVDEYNTSIAANTAQLNADIAGAISSIVTGAMGLGAGAASSIKMTQGEKLGAEAKHDQKKLNEDRDNLDKIRAESDKTLKRESDAIKTEKTKLQDLENDTKKTRDEVTELRDRILSDKNDEKKCAADEAARARLQRNEEELDAAKKEEQEAAKALKQWDESDGLVTPAGVDADLYRSNLHNQHSLQKDEVDRLQLERDTLLDAAVKDNPAAAAPFLQRDRDALRADIASKEREKTELETTLVDLDAKKVRLVEEKDEFIRRLNAGEKVEQREIDRVDTEIQTISAQQTQATQKLDAKNADIAALKVKQDAIDAKLDGLIPPAAKTVRQDLIDGVAARSAKVEALKDKKADLERQIESNDLEVAAARKEVEDCQSGPGTHLAAATVKLRQVEEKQKNLAGELKVTTTDLTSERKALQTERDELESNDLNKLYAAESRLKEQDSEIETSRYAVNKKEAEFLTVQQKDQAVFDAEAKRIEDGMQAVQDKLSAVHAKTEEAAAWRTALDGIGKVLAGFVNLGEATLKKLANDLHTEKERDGRELEILQIAQGIYSSFADNAYQGLGATRDTFNTMLNDLAKTNQAIAQRC